MDNMPDMPVNVPVDDPNADTEWWANDTQRCQQCHDSDHAQGTTSFGNMALSQRENHHPLP